jgi:hypothetical protein
MKPTALTLRASGPLASGPLGLWASGPLGLTECWLAYLGSNQTTEVVAVYYQRRPRASFTLAKWT